MWFFSRNAKGWNIEEPFSWPADGGVVSKLIQKSIELRSLGIMAESMNDLDSVGLGENGVKIIFATDHSEFAIKLAPPLTGSASAKGLSFCEGRKQIFFVNDQLRKDISKRLVSFYRKKYLGTLDSLEPLLSSVAARVKGKKLTNRQQIMVLSRAIKEISITNNYGRIRLLNEKILWRGISPEKFIADFSEIFKFVAITRELRVRSFLSPDEYNKSLGYYGLDNPLIKLTMTGLDGEYITRLLIGKRSGNKTFFAKLNDSKEVFKLSKDNVSVLNRRWYKYYQKSISSFGVKDVISLKITREGIQYLYKGTVGDAWQMVLPHTSPADAMALYTGLFSKKRGFGELIALDIVGEVKDDLSSFGLNKPKIIAVCEYKLPAYAKAYIKKNTAKVSIEIGLKFIYKGKPAYYAKLTNGKVVFVVDKEFVDLLKNKY